MELMNVEQVSLFLNLKKSRIRYMVFTKKIPCFKVGATVLFKKSEIEKWMNSLKQEIRND